MACAARWRCARTCMAPARRRTPWPQISMAASASPSQTARSTTGCWLHCCRASRPRPVSSIFAGKMARSSLRCVALRIDVAHGVGDLHALLLDTVPLRLTGGGTVDLGQETLSLHLLPLARIGATGMSVPVNIRGTFRAPRAAVDARGAGGSLGGHRDGRAGRGPADCRFRSIRRLCRTASVGAFR